MWPLAQTTSSQVTLILRLLLAAIPTFAAFATAKQGGDVLTAYSAKAAEYARGNVSPSADGSASPLNVDEGLGLLGSEPGHGWALTADPRGKQQRGAIIWHIPPRGGFSSGGVRPGSVRLAGDVAQLPSGIAAVGDRLFIIFDDSPQVPPPGPREVVSLSVVANPASANSPATDRWVTRPTGGFDAEPSLRGDGQLLHSVGTQGAMWVLLHGLRDGDADPTVLALYRLCVDTPRATWMRMALPPELDEYSRSVMERNGNRVSMPVKWKIINDVGLAWGSAGLLIVAEESSGVQRWWRAGYSRANSSCGQSLGSRPVTVLGAKASETEELQTDWATWRRGMLDLAELFPGDESKRLELLGGPDGSLFATAPSQPHQSRLFSLSWVASEGGVATSDSVDEYTLRPRMIRNIIFPVTPSPDGKPGGVAADVSGIALCGSVDDASATNVLLFGPPAGPRSALIIGGGRLLTEVSIATGRLHFQERLEAPSPVLGADYRVMFIFALLIVGAVAVFLLRPPGLQRFNFHLPASTSLADPLVRLIAGAADVLLASVIGTGLWRLPVRTLWTAQWWGTPDSLWVLVTLLLLLIGLGTLSEAFFGRTLGKLLTGLRVVSVRGVRPRETQRSTEVPPSHAADLPAKPTITAALVRNCIKWLAPLVALAGLATVTRRHRGDEWAQTAVVEPISEDDEARDGVDGPTESRAPDRSPKDD